MLKLRVDLISRDAAPDVAHRLRLAIQYFDAPVEALLKRIAARVFAVTPDATRTFVPLLIDDLRMVHGGIGPLDLEGLARAPLPELLDAVRTMRAALDHNTVSFAPGFTPAFARPTLCEVFA